MVLETHINEITLRYEEQAKIEKQEVGVALLESVFILL